MTKHTLQHYVPENQLTERMPSQKYPNTVPKIHVFQYKDRPYEVKTNGILKVMKKAKHPRFCLKFAGERTPLEIKSVLDGFSFPE